jgi:MoxR-like ATPase
MSTLARFKVKRTSDSTSPDAPEKFRDAELYDADDALETAVELALELRQPLLLTGEPGCGKTAAAYWAAWYLGLDASDVYHTQIRSTASANELKYEFDNVGFLRESQVAAARGRQWSAAEETEVRRRFIRPGPLWNAFEAARSRSIVLLLDEIDKAPRDFPNDLLHEFDQLEFDVPEWTVEGKPRVVSGRRPGQRARAEMRGPALAEPFLLLFLTSNGERRLPDAFLRRCVHHHLAFNEQRMLSIVRHRAEKRGDTDALTDPFIEYAVKRFMVLKAYPDLNHRPGLAELLIWLRVLAAAEDLDLERLESLQPGELPFLGLLLKDPEDRKRVEPTAR